MKKLLFALLLFVSIPVAAKHIPKYEKADSLKVMELFAKSRTQPKNTNWMLFFGRQLKGIPYVGHTLEGNPRERYLIVNLRELDCTTFVENVLALTLCVKNQTCTFKAFTDMLENIRYNQHVGLTEYPQRLHYFTSWMEDNERLGLIKEIKSPNPPFTATQTLNVHYMTDHSDSYSMLKNQKHWISEIKKTEQSLTGRKCRYIPISQLGDSKLLRQTVKDGDIIVIITNWKGLDTKHIALAVWKKDGLHILDASSIHKKVTEETITLKEYLIKRKITPGIRVARVL